MEDLGLELKQRKAQMIAGLINKLVSLSEKDFQFVMENVKLQRECMSSELNQDDVKKSEQGSPPDVVREKIISAVKKTMQATDLLGQAVRESHENTALLNIGRETLTVVTTLILQGIESDQAGDSLLDMARRIVSRGNALIKMQWDANLDDVRAAGCYKALNSVCRALAENPSEEPDEDYVLSRLVEAIALFANHYKIGIREALHRWGPY